MQLVYTGKTKNVYLLPDGNYMLKLKDDATGENGVFDPGSNAVGLTIEGLGRESLRMSKFFFEKLRDMGVKTHYIDSNLQDVTMTVVPVKAFGQGVEVICRYRAVGSFIRRYGGYIESGAALDGFVEFTLKDDERGDPPITKDGLAALNIMNNTEYEDIKAQTLKICGIIRDLLKEKGLELYDIKLEFGRTKDGIVLMDEISGGSMRVYKGSEWIQPMELNKLIF